MKSLTQLSKQISASPTIALMDKAKQLIADGHDVIALAGGEPDFDTPAHIIKAGIEAIQQGHTHYASPSKGIHLLLEAIAKKTERDNHIQLNPSTDIVVTPGAKWALYLTFKTLLNSGDEVLILDPAWVSYPAMVKMVGGVPIRIALESKDNFRISAERLREHLSPKTKAILICSPSNPTGRVITQDEIQAVAEIAQEADLYVISDEIYEKIIFDGHNHISIGSLAGMAERTITINGMSKGYAMTGWRLGWLAGPTPIMKLAGIFNSQTVTSAATFTMHAAAAALNGSQESVEMMRLAYQKRRDFVVQALNDIEGIHCRSIEGTFYVFPRFINTDKNSDEIAETILQEAQVVGVPGTAFGNSGEKHIRFSIAAEISQLEQAIERIASIAPKL